MYFDPTLLFSRITKAFKTTKDLMYLDKVIKTVWEYKKLREFGVGETRFGEENNKVINILINGDSTAAGYGATSLQGSITWQIGSYFANKNYRVNITNIAIDGSLIGDLRFGEIPTKENKYDLTILMVGSNDLFRRINPEKSNKDLREVLEKYTRVSERIIFLGPGRVDILNGIKKNFDPETGSSIKKMFREHGLKMSKLFKITIDEFPQVFYSDPQTLIDPYKKYSEDMTSYQAPDGFHPNDKAYSEYAMDLLKFGFEYFQIN